MRSTSPHVTLALVGLLVLITRSADSQKVFDVPFGASIAAKVASAKFNFKDRVEFAIKGLKIPGRKKQVDIKLRATSAFGDDSTYSIGDGISHRIVSTQQILVSANEQEPFSVLSVDIVSGYTHGFLSEQADNGKNKGKSLYTIRQRKGEAAEASTSDDFKPPAWECGVNSENELKPATMAKDAGDRALGGEKVGHQHGAQDLHDNVEYHHDHHFDLNSGDDLADALDEMGKNLRRNEKNTGRRLYYTDDYPKKYTYQVDMYIEIDQAFEDSHGSFLAALNYIDVLISAANSIYEMEVDTHLHVVHVAKTDRYDEASKTSDALSIMRSDFAGSSWHYANVDIHHALLGNRLGGGIAYVGALCNSQYGFGLSANLAGNFRTLDTAAVWDLVVFTHELGHNFGSGHTHDTNQYSPPVDTCGSGCPSDLLPGSATIMSYCHGCGGMSNIAYTFGGNRDDNGDWKNADLSGSISTNSKRVPEKMYKHVTSRGSCLLPTHEVPLQECGGSSCDDNDACTFDSCSEETCVHTPITCDDGNVCTIDTCSDIDGCQFELTENAVIFELNLVTDKYGGETSWQLFGGSEVIASGSDYSSSSTFNIQHAICSSPCYTFVIKDAWGDGICCGYGSGSYTLKVDGEVIKNGGAFGSEESFDFCTFTPTPAPVTPPTPSPVPPPTPSPVPPPPPPPPPPTDRPTTIPSSNPSGVPTAFPSRMPIVPPTQPPVEDAWTELFFDNFETPRNWGHFNDGMAGNNDANRHSAGTFSHSGVASLKIQDDSGVASSVYSDAFDVSSYALLKVNFWYFPFSMDNSNEDFLLEYSTNGGSSWVVVKSWAKGIDFLNGAWVEEVQEFSASGINTVQIRFRCDASRNNDKIFIDDVRFSGK